MGYIDRAQENARMAAKAAAFDKMELEKREQAMYSQGANDISTEVERQLRSMYSNNGSDMSGRNIYNAGHSGLAQNLVG